MFKNRILHVLVLLVIPAMMIAQNQPNPVVENYVRTYADLAVKEMQRTGVPAAIKLAQGILETDAGRSDLVVKSNNHFGIKCKSWWNGEKVYHDDDEKGECFRKYADPYDSWKDHSDYLRTQPRYSSLFNLSPEDYKGWARGLKKAGYATNPRYPEILIRYIEQYNLHDYTLIALGKIKPSDEYFAVYNSEVKTSQSVFVDGISIAQNSGSGPSRGESVLQTAVPPPPKEYPSGEFRINDTKVIYANAGTSLLAISEQYKIRLGWLADFNELDKKTDILEKDQLIFLQRKRRHGENEFHIVREGENIRDISQETGIRLRNLLDYNQLEEDMIPAPGQKLYLRSDAPSRPLLASQVRKQQPVMNEPTGFSVIQERKTEPDVTVQKHTVQSKETLYSLARKYQVSQDQIREWNKLTSGDLKIGQELLIYKNR